MEVCMIVYIVQTYTQAINFDTCNNPTSKNDCLTTYTYVAIYSTA